MLKQLYKQLEQSKDLYNGYSTKVSELHKQIKILAFNILHSGTIGMEQYATKLAKCVAELEACKTELKLLATDIEITESDIADLESEV